MALTPAEKQKAYRERKKAEAEQAQKTGPDVAAQLYRTPFSEWAKGDANIDDCDTSMGLAGMVFPGFYDERDPEEVALEQAIAGVDEPFGEAKGALGRAEVMIDGLLETAIILARSVNEYKRSELQARIKELEQSTEIDRATAMKQAVRLNKILNQLDKQVRRPFAQWKVTGI